MIRRALMPMLVLLIAGGCGYFNSLYNANRRFADAERALRNGDAITADREYRQAIDRAAASYRRYPDSRWADDALLLVGRARFALGEYDAAAAAMRRLLDQSQDEEARAIGQAYLGATFVISGDHDRARAELDAAAGSLDEQSEDGAFARLWRARAAFESGRDGWTDLSVALASERTARDAAVEGVSRAIAVRDSARILEFMASLARERAAGRYRVQVDSLLGTIAEEWSPAIAFHVSAPLADARWQPDAKDAIALTRASIAHAAGYSENGLAIALDVANEVSGGLGSRARRLAARIQLDSSTSPDDLEEIRDLLRPAFDDQAALQLMRSVQTALVLIHDGEDPARSLSLFAAAELLRDELDARLMARSLFLRFAQQNPQEIWAGKSVLAAHELLPSDETAVALDQLAGNAYVIAARGGSAPEGAIDRAEERLAHGLSGLREEARVAAIQRDVVVGRAVAVLDSTRRAVRNDSIRIACGTFIDSLQVKGVRADSTRAACLRGDSARVAFVLTADTALLRDSTFVGQPDPAIQRRTTPDTVTYD